MILSNLPDSVCASLETSLLPPVKFLLQAILDVFSVSEAVTFALVELVSPIDVLDAAALFELLDKFVGLVFGDHLVVGSLKQQDGCSDLVGCKDWAPVVV